MLLSLLLLPLGACSGLTGTSDKGYVSANGQVTELAPKERDEPVELGGKDLDGASLSVDHFRGQVVVINVWGAWCVECRKEAPALVELVEELGSDDVVFLGIDIRDPSREAARAFVRSFDIPFRSLYDPSGKSLLAFQGAVGPYAIPSTVVLDRKGRLASVIQGQFPSKTTVRNLVEKVVAEDG